MEPTRPIPSPSHSHSPQSLDVPMGETDQATQKAAKRTFEEIASSDDPSPLRQKPRLDQIRNLIEQFEKGSAESIEEIFKLATPEILQDLAGWFIVNQTKNHSRYDHLFGSKLPSVEFIYACCDHPSFQYDINLFITLLEEIVDPEKLFEKEWIDNLIPLLFHSCIKHFDPAISLALKHLFTNLVLSCSCLKFFEPFVTSIREGRHSYPPGNDGLVKWIESVETDLPQEEFLYFLHELADECPSVTPVYPLLLAKSSPIAANPFDAKRRLTLLSEIEDLDPQQLETEIQTLIPILCHAKDLSAFEFISKFNCSSRSQFAPLQKSLIENVDLFALFNSDLHNVISKEFGKLCLDRLLREKIDPSFAKRLLIYGDLFSFFTNIYNCCLPEEWVNWIKEWLNQIKCTNKEWADLYYMLTSYTCYPVLPQYANRMEGELCKEEIELLLQQFRIWGILVRSRKKVTYAQFDTAEVSTRMLLKIVFSESFKDSPEVDSPNEQDVLEYTLFVASGGLRKLQWSPALEEKIIHVIAQTIGNSDLFNLGLILFLQLFEWTSNRSKLATLFHDINYGFSITSHYWTNGITAINFIKTMINILQIDKSFVKSFKANWSPYLDLFLRATAKPPFLFIQFIASIALQNPNLFPAQELYPILQKFLAKPLSVHMLLPLSRYIAQLEDIYGFKLPILFSENPIPRIQQREKKGGHY